MNTVADAKIHAEGMPQGSGARQRSSRPRLIESVTEHGCSILHRLIRFRAYCVVSLEPGDISPEFDLASCQLPGRAITGPELETIIGQQQGLGASFVRRSRKEGDWCYAFFDAGRLVSSGWYTERVTPVGNAFQFEFPEDYVYMHRGRTEKDQRGRRLHGYGMAEAARIACAGGKRGLISLIEAQNHASFRSSLRLGYKRLGTFFTFRLAGRWISIRSPAIRRLGCKLEAR